MQTLLDQYRERQKALASSAAADKPADAKGYFAYMELMYRIQVLECFRNLVNTAPISTRRPVLSSHYAAVDALVSHLLMERRYQPSRDLETQQARDTARQALISIVKDYRKRFSAYMSESEEQYRTGITKVIHTILPAWVAYRETMLAISEDKE